ncbi:hypothetical protein jhhlp_005162 [Lomentospora prolificans]|uniref:Transcription initiation factor IIA large subunit n=1 Tax=Lomentospora prolificans TaxID=41688 RepID=A0A2N3N6Z6_9PEZI|nr:hypothetical protein jhhlp_005162 [Lomentospora prolificans]
MSNAVVGNVYDQIIKDVIESSRVDFEEGGVDESVLDELREGWQKKLSQLRVAEFPWDPKPDATGLPASGAPAPGNAAAAFAQQQLSPQSGAQALPLPAMPAAPNGQQLPGDIKPEPEIKQEPGLHSNVMPPSFSTDPRTVAAARASEALQKSYGNRATSSINAIQAGMTAQAQGLNGHNPNPQGYQQGQQNQPGHLHMPQTDGADEVQAEGVLMGRNSAGEMIEMGRVDIDQMLHEKILAKAKTMEGGGFMVPLEEALKHPSKARRQKTEAVPQVDGGDDDEGEDAINSDLDDSDDDRDDSEVDDEGLSHIMLCMYDKVQRVRNKWKCTLKDGVLTVNGKEYVFHKATGEYEW